MAEALAAEGCRLVLVSRRAADLDVARTQIDGRYNVSVRTDAADLSDSTNVPRLARLFPDVDILVNNAGAIPGGTLFDVDEARWRTAWDLKVLRTINMTRAFYPLMKARGGGVIINVIGNAARTHDPGYICGVTGNAGLTAFTEAIGSGSMRDGIRVNGVSPGPTATDQLVNLAGRKAQEQFGDPARSMPYTTPTRKVYDSGAFAAHLSRAGHPGKEAAPTAGFSC